MKNKFLSLSILSAVVVLIATDAMGQRTRPARTRPGSGYTTGSGYGTAPADTGRRQPTTGSGYGTTGSGYGTTGSGYGTSGGSVAPSSSMNDTLPIKVVPNTGG